jgi:hypothetical protein
MYVQSSYLHRLLSLSDDLEVFRSLAYNCRKLEVKVKAPPFYRLPFDVCQDFVVDCSALAAASSLPNPNYHQSQHRIMTPYGPETVSSRLHALLESAREANNPDANRISLRDFLARLQNEAEATEGSQLRQNQVCIYKLQ